jgi:hypothetical protein
VYVALPDPLFIVTITDPLFALQFEFTVETETVPKEPGVDKVVCAVVKQNPASVTLIVYKLDDKPVNVCVVLNDITESPFEQL